MGLAVQLTGSAITGYYAAGLAWRGSPCGLAFACGTVARAAVPLPGLRPALMPTAPCDGDPVSQGATYSSTCLLYALIY